MTDTIRIIGGVALKQIPAALLAPHMDVTTIGPAGLSARQVVAITRGVTWDQVPVEGHEDELLRLLAEYVTANPPAAPRRYGCHNRPRPTSSSAYIAQAGWIDIEKQGLEQVFTRQPVYKLTYSAFGTTTCQYDKSATDAACAGCQHAKQEG